MSKGNGNDLIYLYVRLSASSTSEEIDYDSPEYKGPPKSLLKWYSYLSDEYKDNGTFRGLKSGGNESDAKPSFSDILKAKACMLAKTQTSDASSKAKVQACGSKAKLQTSGSKSNLQTSPKTLIVKSPVPITNSILRLANAKTWDAILSKTFGVKIPLTMAYKDITNKDTTDEDCIHECNYAMSKGKYVPVSHKHNPKVKSHVPVIGYVLGLANVTTLEEIMNKMGVRKSKICADKAKEENKACICKQAFAACICKKAFLACICKQAFAACTCSLHLQLAFASKHLQLAFASKHLHLAFA
ncbi:hypothetical protein Tco_0958323, partial [Tanacetum coccineum]